MPCNPQKHIQFKNRKGRDKNSLHKIKIQFLERIKIHQNSRKKKSFLFKSLYWIIFHVIFPYAFFCRKMYTNSTCFPNKWKKNLITNRRYKKVININPSFKKICNQFNYVVNVCMNLFLVYSFIEWRKIYFFIENRRIERRIDLLWTVWVLKLTTSYACTKCVRHSNFHRFSLRINIKLFQAQISFCFFFKVLINFLLQDTWPKMVIFAL